MNYFPFHVGDYAAHTGHLEPMEDLAYRRLLDQYYLREGPLPADIQVTAKLVRMRSMAADVECVLREFFVLTDEGWRHERCEQELAHMRDKQAKARASAAKSVAARQASAQAAAERAFASLSTDVERSLPESQTDVELPTPTPTPTPTEEQCTHTQPLAPGWALPKSWGEWAVAENPHWSPEAVRKIAETFRDHWLASGGVSADWEASWRKWCRDDLTQRANRKAPSRPDRAKDPPATVPSDAAAKTAEYLRLQAEAAEKAVPPPEFIQALSRKSVRAA